MQQHRTVLSLLAALLAWCLAVGNARAQEAPVDCTPERECCPEQKAGPKGPITGGKGRDDGGGQASQTGGQSDPSKPTTGGGHVDGVSSHELNGTTNSNDGAQETTLDNPGADNAGDGVAGCYSSFFRVTNRRDRRYRLESDEFGFLPRPGGGCVLWPPAADCTSQEALRDGCSMQQIKTLDLEHLVEISVWTCVCSPAQVGGSGAMHLAPFKFASQSQDLQSGAPLIFQSEVSGAELWYFYPFDNYGRSYLEVRHYDGTIARYERAPNARLVDTVTLREGDYYRLAWTRDPFDNKTTYTYGAANRLSEVVYPNGLKEIWNWTPSWISAWGGGSGSSGIEVRYEDASGSPLSDLTYAMVFENVVEGAATHTHFGGRFHAYFAAATPCIAAPSAGATFDPATVQTKREVTEFLYGTSGAGPHDVSEVRKYWYSSIAPPEPASDVSYPRTPTLATSYYTSGAHSGRVASQTIVQLGLTTSYEYDAVAPTYPGTLPSGVALSTVRVTGPDGATEIREFDPITRRVYRHIVDPGADGRPRHAEGSFSIAGYPFTPEPARLAADMYYDATCVCQKPIKVRTGEVDASGAAVGAWRETEYTYDPVTKLVLTQIAPNPSTASGAPATVTTTFEYHAEPGAWSPRWIKRQSTAVGTSVQSIVEYAYPAPMTRASLAHGKMQGKVERTFVDVDLRLSPTTTGQTDVTDSLVYNIPGNPALGTLSYSGPTSGQSAGYPRGQVRVSMDGDGTETVFQYSAVHGRLAAVYTADASSVIQSSFDFDIWGRLSSRISNVGTPLACAWTVVQDARHRTLSETCTTVANVAQQYYYDKWGNLALVLAKNMASNGQSPKRHGAATTAREWVRSEYVWHYSRLVEVRVDRRPLDEGDSAPLGGQNPLLAVTQIEHDERVVRVTSPNGAITEYVFDGYGQLFRTSVLESAVSGAPVLEMSRNYRNTWMEPIAVVVGRPSLGASQVRWTILSRNAAGAITSLTEPEAPASTAPAGYTGSLGGAYHEYDIDELGRAKGRRVLSSFGGAVLTQARFFYDQLDRQRLTEVDLLGAPVQTAWTLHRYEHGKLSRLHSTQSNDTPLVRYTYDVAGRLTSIYDDQALGGNRIEYVYKIGTHYIERTKRTLVNPGGASTTTYEVLHELDPLGRVTTTREAPGTSVERVHGYAFSSLGFVDTYTDPMQKVQKVLHDAQSRLIEHVRLGDSGAAITNTAGYVDTGLANSRTRVDQVDGLGHITATHFDFAGRAFIEQSPGANFATEPSASAPNKAHCKFVTFDALSQVTNFYDGDNGNTALHYDGLGRLIQRELLTAQEGISTFNTKDVLNRDALGRIIAVKVFGATNGGAPNGTPLANGFPLVEQASAFDSLGRPLLEQSQFVLTTNALSVGSTFSGVSGFRTGLSYDDGLSGAASQPLSMTFTPDAVNRLAQIDWTRPGLGSQTLANYTWRGGMRMSRSTHYGGASVQATGVATFDYDALGRLTWIRDGVTPTGSSTDVETNKFGYEYDLANNLKKEIYAKVGGWKGDRFTYDAYHRLKESHLGVVDALMQLPATTDPTGYNAAETARKVSYTLDGAQNRDEVRLQQGATDVTYPYTLEDSTTGFPPSNRYVTAHGAPVAHDQRGNLTYDGNLYYRYDYLNRLQEVWRVIPGDQEGQAAMAAPPAGEKYVPVTVDALEDSRQVVYNQVYNLLHRVPAEHQNASFRAQLRRTIVGGVVRILDPASTAPGGGGGGGMPQFVLPANLELVALYGYDAFNRRVMRVVVGVETWVSTYDGWREVVEHRLNLASNKAEPVKQFVHGSRLDEVLSYRRRVDVGGSPTWENYFLQHGGQDTPSRLLNEQGQVVERYEYDAYGAATIYNTALSVIPWASSHGLPFLWKATRWDCETGLSYVRNRYYSSATGRFLSVDPIGEWSDPLNAGNGYSYVGASPLVGNDPLGLQGEPGGPIAHMPLTWVDGRAFTIVTLETKYNGEDATFERQVDVTDLVTEGNDESITVPRGVLPSWFKDGVAVNESLKCALEKHGLTLGDYLHGASMLVSIGSAFLAASGPVGWLIGAALVSTGLSAAGTVAKGGTVNGVTVVCDLALAIPLAKLGRAALSAARKGSEGARGARKAAGEAFHYTSGRAVSSIERDGLRAGSYATPAGNLSPLQAHIDLALPANRGLRDALIRIDLAGLRQAGYEIPVVTRVGRSFGMPGGGFEMQFPYSIPAEFLTVIRP